MLAAIISGSVWYFRAPIIDFSRKNGLFVGTACAVCWAILYWALDYPYAQEIDRFLIRSAAMVNMHLDVLIGMLIVGGIAGLMAGLTGERGSLFMALGLFFPVIAFAISTTVWFTMDSDTAFQEGVEYMEKEQYRRAIKYFNRAIELDDRNDRAYRRRGRCFAILEEPAKALADYDRTLELDKDQPDVYRERADIYLEEDRPNAALDDMSAAIALDPESADNYRKRAEIYEKLGMEGSAAADREKEKELLRKRLLELED